MFYRDSTPSQESLDRARARATLGTADAVQAFFLAGSLEAAPR